MPDTTQPAPPSDGPLPPETTPPPPALPSRRGPETTPDYAVTRSWPAGLPAAANPEPAHTEPRPGNRNRFWRTTGIVLLAALVGAAAASGAWLIFDDEPGDGSAVTVVERVATEILSPEESGSIAASVARRVLPSIVTVQVSTSDVGTFVPEGSGSGVVLTTDGLLATNQHVVDGAIQVRVVFADGRSYGAEIVGTDALTDLAVLRIEAAGLTAVELGSMDSMSIGDTAIAVGSPLGLDGGPSVTVGVISAFDRRVQTSIDEQLYGMLQTDAPITRGSSGGALVDDRGRLIGITTAIGVSDVGAEGLGFAIPIDLVTRITDDLIDFGEARHAFLGVTGSTFFTQAEDGATIPAGVEVASVFDGTAAALAGVQVGDVIRLVDGEAVTTMEQLVTTIRLFRVDESIDLVILRDGTEQTISVSLMERPEDV